MHIILRLLANPYYVNIGLLAFWAVVILNNKTIKDRNRVFTYLAVVQWILISGLRHITIGGRDVYITYNYGFERALNTSWTETGRRLVDSMFSSSGAKEPGYLVFQKLVGLFTDDYQVYLFAVAIAFMIPFGIFVYRNSREPFMSFLIYSTLFYSFFSLTGFRQTIATAILPQTPWKLKMTAPNNSDKMTLGRPKYQMVKRSCHNESISGKARDRQYRH